MTWMQWMPWIGAVVAAIVAALALRSAMKRTNIGDMFDMGWWRLHARYAWYMVWAPTWELKRLLWREHRWAEKISLTRLVDRASRVESGWLQMEAAQILDEATWLGDLRDVTLQEFLALADREVEAYDTHAISESGSHRAVARMPLSMDPPAEAAQASIRCTTSDFGRNARTPARDLRSGRSTLVE